MFKTTKVHHPDAKSTRYAIVGTRLHVSRDPAPRYGQPQTWSVVAETDEYGDDCLIEGKGKTQALQQLERVLNHALPEGTPNPARFVSSEGEPLRELYAVAVLRSLSGTELRNVLSTIGAAP
jgi:hypothetical protein